MRRVSLVLVASLFFGVLTPPLSAQGDDPSEIFLKAYLSAQQGEKLEHENRFKTSLAKFRFAGSLIEELRKSHRDWQPAIVEYRGRKIGEAILRVQERMSRQSELGAAASPLPEVVPSLLENEAWSEPGPEVVAPQGLDAVSQGSSDVAIEEATKKLRHKVDQLQAALEKSHAETQTARKEKQAVTTHLQETSSKLKDAQKEVEASKESERQVRDQLTSAQALQRNNDVERLHAQIADLKNQVAGAEEARAAAARQRDETNAKLAEANNQIAAVEQQRDEPLARLITGSGTQRHLQTLLSKSGELRLTLTNAEEGGTRSDKLTNPEQLVEVQQQVIQLQQQLTESQRENQYLVARIGELWVQLDGTGAQPQRAKLAGKNSEETDQLMRENQLLRNIVVRERQEEARRDEARKLMLAELDNLNIKSDALNKEIEVLAQPFTKLNSEELSLLRQPVVSVSDQSPGVLTASFIFAKESAADSVEAQAAANDSRRLNGDVGDDPRSAANAAARESFGGASIEPQKAMAGNAEQGSE